MVFLRLTIKVMPPEPVPRGKDMEGSSLARDYGNGGSVTNAVPPGKVIAFLIPIHNPEEVTLGALAGLIREKWEKLRPNSEPLGIKKILHIDHPDENLDVDLTVADVFVQHGATDGQDQRGVAVIVQKSAHQPTFEREGSVVQDWAGAAARSHSSLRRGKRSSRPKSKIATINENEPVLSDSGGDTTRPDLSSASMDDSLQGGPVSSIEHEDLEKTTDHHQSPHPEDSLLDGHGVQVEDEDFEEKYGTPHPWNETGASSVLYGREASEELGVSPSSQKSWVPWPFDDDPPFTGDDQFTDDDREHVASSDNHAPSKKTSNKEKCKATQNRQADVEDHDADGDVSMVGTVPGPAQAQQKSDGGKVPVILVENKPLDDRQSSRKIAPKRKRNSGDDLRLAKEPRLESTPRPSTPPAQPWVMEDKNPVTPVHTTTQVRPREGPPSFSSPQKGLDFSNRPVHIPEGSMGLGFTCSPKYRRKLMKFYPYRNPKATAADMAAIRFDPDTNSFTNAQLPTSTEIPASSKTSPPKDNTTRSVSLAEDKTVGEKLPSQKLIVPTGIEISQADSSLCVTPDGSIDLNGGHKQQGAEIEVISKDPNHEQLPKGQSKGKKETSKDKVGKKNKEGKIEKGDTEPKKSNKKKTETEKTDTEKVKEKTKKKAKKLGPLPPKVMNSIEGLPGEKSTLPTQKSSQPQSSAPSEASLPPVEKARSSIALPAPQKTAPTRQIPNTDGGVQASKKTPKTKHLHGQSDSPTPNSHKSEASHASTATRQLHSELELASTQTPTKVHRTPSVSVEIPTAKTLAAKPAMKSKKAQKPEPSQESTSQSESESESESDSNDELFVGVLKDLEKNPAKFSLGNITSPRVSSWNPVNANKRHTIKSVREDLRKEMKTEKPKKAQAGKKTNAAKSKQPAPESSSSDDSSDFE